MAESLLQISEITWLGVKTNVCKTFSAERRLPKGKRNAESDIMES